MRLFANIEEIKDRRIITITESQMFNLILEAATIQDIYQKYYSNIPEDIFQEIISADPTYNPQKPQKMGKYGKWLLGIYLKGNLKTEDLYKATDYLSYFVKFNGKIQQKDIMKYKSLPELYNVVEPFISNPDQAATKSEEVRKIKEGAEKVYEDAKWMVIVPHTQEASCYYGKGTQWCTAATGSQNYFNYYNKKGLLYINILKGTDTKYQFHFETNSFMDATDTSISHPVAATIGLTKNLINFYTQKYGAIACVDLTTGLDTDHIKTIDKLPNYIYYTSNRYILKYDEQEQKLNIVYTLNDGETIGSCCCRRFISITEQHRWYACINLFDIKYNKLVFDENDNIDYIEFLYVDNPDRTEYINIHEKNDTQRIFSLKTMTYTSEEIGENYMVDSPLCEWNVDYEIPQFYNNDLTMLQNENYNVAFYSLSQGKLLSDFFKKQRTWAISYNLNGKVTELGFFVLYNEKPNEQDAILIMYDGKIYPLNIFRQNLNQILDEYFSNIQESKNRKSSTITESQMFDLILEAATIQDIYQKYYSNIPEDIFQEIISADPTYNPQKPQKMGKFGKWLLGIYLKGNLKTEDLYKATQYLSIFVKFNGKIQQKDIMKYKSLPELYTVVEPFISNPDQAASKSEEVRKIKEGAEKVYEDEKWMVIVPHTQEASCYYGKGTQWCTAATDSGNYFDNYNAEGLLYINILKGTDTKYQFHFETGSYMDATDKDILHPVAETIGLTENLVNFYKQKYGKIAVIDLTTELYTNKLESITNLPNYYLYDDTKIMKYNEQEQEFDIVYTVNDNYKQIQDFSINKRFIPICEDDYYVNLFDTQYDEIVFDENDNIDDIDFKNCDYIVIHNGNMQRIFSLKTMNYTSEEFDNKYEVLNPLYKGYGLEYYNHDLTIVSKLIGEYYFLALYSLSQGKLLSDFFKGTRKETFYYNLNGKVTALKFKVLINKNNDYQEAMLIMYDGKLYPLNLFSQKSDQILDEYFSNNNRN